jgi:hypothetical protein
MLFLASVLTMQMVACDEQGHEVVLESLPSKVAALVPNEEFVEAVTAAGLRASEPRFINFAQLAAMEALQVQSFSVRAECCLAAWVRS